MKFVQFELFKHCNNNCLFCYNKFEHRLPQIEQMNMMFDIIKDDKIMSSFNEIGFIGGEFFDNQLEDREVKKTFYSIFNYIIPYFEKKIFKKLYVTTSFIYKDTKQLEYFLEYCKQVGLDKYLLICTSWDSKFRFNNKGSKEQWENNMDFVSKQYPNVLKHTEIILTQYFINDVLKEKFKIKDFKKDFHTDIDFIQPNTGYHYKTKYEMEEDIEGFYPTEESFLKFLKKTIAEEKDIDPNRLLNKEFHSSRLYSVSNKNLILFDDRQHTKQTHFDNADMSGCIDSNKTMREIVLEGKWK